MPTAFTSLGSVAWCGSVKAARQTPADPGPSGQVYSVMAEILVIPFVGFVFLTLAWIGVAIGLRKPFDS